ncbi:MAG: iron-sulfur cluster carrier protein ApbC, partial [Stenotrophomonas maltophilia]
MSTSQPRRPHASQVQKGLSPHPRVRNVIAVGSGKG